MNILFVDDHLDLLDLYVEELGEEFPHFNFFKAENGKEALELCSKVSIDHIFTDVKMPVMGGLELAKMMKKDHPEVKIYIISGFVGDVAKDDILSMGVEKLFDKPIDYDELISFISNL